MRPARSVTAKTASPARLQRPCSAIPPPTPIPRLSNRYLYSIGRHTCPTKGRWLAPLAMIPIWAALRSRRCCVVLQMVRCARSAMVSSLLLPAVRTIPPTAPNRGRPAPNHRMICAGTAMSLTVMIRRSRAGHSRSPRAPAARIAPALHAIPSINGRPPTRMSIPVQRCIHRVQQMTGCEEYPVIYPQCTVRARGRATPSHARLVTIHTRGKTIQRCSAAPTALPHDRYASSCHRDQRSTQTSMHAAEFVDPEHHSQTGCGPCHSTHAAEQTRKGLLWSAGVEPSAEKSTDQLCLGCHGRSGTATRLANWQHPATFLGRAGLPTTLPSSGQVAAIPAINDITCSTCHLPHGKAPTKPAPAGTSLAEIRVGWKLMLQPDVDRKVCASCHGIDAPRLFLYFHDPKLREAARQMLDAQGDRPARGNSRQE